MYMFLMYVGLLAKRSCLVCYLELQDQWVFTLFQWRQIQPSLILFQPLQRKHTTGNEYNLNLLLTWMHWRTFCLVCTCLFSASFTASLTWLRTFLQHSPALFTFSLSSQSSAGELTKQTKKKVMKTQNRWMMSNSVFSPVPTCVFSYVVQEQWVLSQSLHLYRNDVFEPQPATQTVALCLLKTKWHDIINRS